MNTQANTYRLTTTNRKINFLAVRLALQFLFVFPLAQLLLADVTTTNIAYEVTGTIKRQFFGYVNNVKTVQASNLMGFCVEVGPTGWLISVYPLTTNQTECLAFYQDGTDGTDVYSVSYPKKPLNAQNAMDDSVSEKKQSWNQAVATVYKNEAPRGGFGNSATLWLAYASHQYLRNATDHMLPKLWGVHVVCTNKLRAEWECFTQAPHLPLQVRFFNEGIRFFELNKVVKYIFLKPPFDKGYIEACYDAGGAIERDGVCVPKAFCLKTFVPVPRATNVSQVCQSTQIEGETLSLRTVGEKKSYLPPVTVPTAVQDNRPQSSGHFSGGDTQYRAFSNWLGEIDTQSPRVYAGKLSKQQSGLENTFANKKHSVLNAFLCVTSVIIISIGLWAVLRKGLVK